MLFNSIEFALFLPVVFVLYWFVFNKTLKAQNLLLLGASYFFYASWDYRFLFLLMFSTFLDYFTGLKMASANSVRMRKFWFWLSITVNLGFLGAFKYYNFFAASFTDFMAHFGVHTNYYSINVILPVGISFYTFHGLSYVIDIYKNRIKPEKNFIDYAVFVSFFPLLVAGPIERATHLLPQIQKDRTFNYTAAMNGMRQILWGLFKKVVIADNCAIYVNRAFIDTPMHNGSTLFMGAFMFSMQIYCDFSGYSDIAIGVARLFGIDLLRNFAYPFFSRDFAEYWRRWHISLFSWFRDYIYFPLTRGKANRWIYVRNTFIVFVISAFWHGANWTFIAWGFVNAILVTPFVIFRINKRATKTVAQGKYLPSVKEFLQMASTYLCIVISGVFFRALNIGHAMTYYSSMFKTSLFSRPESTPLLLLAGITIFMLIEWLGRTEEFAIANFGLKWPSFVRYSFYYSLCLVILYFAGAKHEFLYFQF